MYKAGTVSVSDSAWTELSPSIDIAEYSLFSEDGAFYVQLKVAGDYGDTLKVYQNAGFSDSNAEATNIRVKSVSGTINISYYIDDNK